MRGGCREASYKLVHQELEGGDGDVAGFVRSSLVDDRQQALSAFGYTTKQAVLFLE